MWRGFCKSGKRFQCKCGAWGHTQESKSDYSYSSNGETAEYVVTTEKRIVSEKDIIELIHLDTKEWKILEFKIGTNEAHRKARQVNLRWEDGRIIEGEVHDDGKMLVVPLHTIRVRVVRETQEIRNNLVVEDIKKDLIKFAPKYSKIHYPKLKNPLLYEICLFDAHVGKLVWAEESGENSDLKTQTQRIIEVFEKLLSYSKNYPIERILIPLGGDFFNSDNKFDTTTAGTRVDEDTRYQKTFRAGRVLATTLIDMCAKVAPVDVLVISGNHDESRSFYLGDAISSWYHNNPNVHIDNSAKRRKYFSYGKDLIMVAHGSEEKLNKLPGIMAMEVPELWAKSKFREVHSGHTHHRETILFKAHEEQGVVVRVISSPSPTDSWHASKGFIGAMQGSEAFLWDKNDGLLAQFTAVATPGETC